MRQQAGVTYVLWSLLVNITMSLSTIRTLTTNLSRSLSISKVSGFMTICTKSANLLSSIKSLKRRRISTLLAKAAPQTCIDRNVAGIRIRPHLRFLPIMQHQATNLYCSRQFTERGTSAVCIKVLTVSIRCINSQVKSKWKRQLKDCAR